MGQNKLPNTSISKQKKGNICSSNFPYCSELEDLWDNTCLRPRQSCVGLKKNIYIYKYIYIYIACIYQLLQRVTFWFPNGGHFSHEKVTRGCQTRSLWRTWYIHSKYNICNLLGKLPWFWHLYLQRFCCPKRCSISQHLPPTIKTRMV